MQQQHPRPTEPRDDGPPRGRDRSVAVRHRVDLARVDVDTASASAEAASSEPARRRDEVPGEEPVVERDPVGRCGGSGEAADAVAPEGVGRGGGEEEGGFAGERKDEERGEGFD